jgi:hypothetical protein
MPTYRLNSSWVYPHTEAGITIWNATVETYHVLTEAIVPYVTASGTYTLGELVTETTSGITGNIYWDSGTELGLINASGDFVGAKTLTGFSSSVTSTGGVARNILTRTSDDPIATSLLHLTKVTSTGSADPKTVALDANTTWVMITNITGANVTINNEVTAHIIAFCRIGSAWSHDMRLIKDASKLLLEFDAVAACTADVYQFDSGENPLA